VDGDWGTQFPTFYAATVLARLSHRIPVCPSVCHTSRSVKNGAS